MRRLFSFTILLICIQFSLIGCSESSSPQNSGILASEASSNAKSNCPTGDCIAHEISSQDTCVESTASPQQDSRWYQNLSLQTDQLILNGEIAAYQIRWFNGKWSRWFVPGVNDIDHKYNLDSNRMRRMWSYFYDHEHKYIICKEIG